MASMSFSPVDLASLRSLTTIVASRFKSEQFVNLFQLDVNVFVPAPIQPALSLEHSYMTVHPFESVVYRVPCKRLALVGRGLRGWHEYPSFLAARPTDARSANEGRAGLVH